VGAIVPETLLARHGRLIAPVTALS